MAACAHNFRHVLGDKMMQALIYAIGDVHGRADLLARLYDLVRLDRERFPDGTATIVMLGDYVDRGPDSRGVLELICRGVPGFTMVTLLGNHEDMMLAFLDNGEKSLQDGWFRNGAVHTVSSYGVPCRGLPELLVNGHTIRRKLINAMPLEHRRLLDTALLVYETPHYVFAHGGVDAGVPMDRQSRKFVLWRRWSWGEDVELPGRILVHGHDVVGDHPLITPTRIAVDTGAYESNVLSCVVLGGERPRVIQAVLPDDSATKL